ncbi:MAG: methyltransferase domain-containing protein [Chloroflexi bacterium]|nr:MAG: methyltransferase domain-containing protein [Chloroflexota bacterium]
MVEERFRQWQTGRPFLCPVCGQGLERITNSLRCPDGHVFDIAREGYVNLLAGGKQTKVTGDLPEMVRARRRFLEAGYYEPLAQMVGEYVAEWLADKSEGETAVLDVGCGEGYFLNQVRIYCRNRDVAWLGMDVSKTAVRLAARRYPTMRFVVGDVWQQIPVANSAVSVLLNIFAPRNPTEFRRVLAPNGRLLLIHPTPNHLHQLRQYPGILSIQPQKTDHITRQLHPWFQPITQKQTEFTFTLTQPHLNDLWHMTPSYHHLTPTQKEKLANLDTLQLTASFVLQSFKPVSN